MTTFCAMPRQCPLQHVCARNLDIWRGPMPVKWEFKVYEAPPDAVCTGFEEKK